MNWVKGNLPTEAGWYAVIIAGDSETDGPHVYYDYPDYQTFGQWVPAQPDEFEDFEGGYKGGWSVMHDEESETIIGWCGPLDIPTDWREQLK
jgi:hypothetical protein